MLFDNEKTYTPKEVREKLHIDKKTLLKYCDNELNFIQLPGSNHRRFLGTDLNSFFNKT